MPHPLVVRLSGLEPNFDVDITRRGKWGNPFVIGIHGNRREVIAKHREWIDGKRRGPNGQVAPSKSEIKSELKGKRLGCVCCPRSCHGDYLAEVANAKETRGLFGSLTGKRMAKNAKQAGQADLFSDNDGLFAVDDQNRLESIVEFIYERHKVYLKKSVLQREKPWTKDPFLSNYRFCNIYRELDTVSLWIYDNIIVPFEKHPDLWFMLCIARLINWPDTLQEMMEKGVWPAVGPMTPKGNGKFLRATWDKNKVYEVLKDRANRKEKLITGAYIVNSVIPKGHETEDRSKAYYIPHIGLDQLWQAREEIAPHMNKTLEGAVEKLRNYTGWGAFMAYQVVVDLSYSDRWLGMAPDYNSYTSPGPGTTRGMNRLMYGGKIVKKRADELNEPMQKALKKVNLLLEERVAKGGERWWTDDHRTGFQELSMSNFSNSLCEYDKYCRLLGGEGEPRSRYDGHGSVSNRARSKVRS